MPSSRLKVAGAAAAAGVWAISHEPDVVEAEGEGSTVSLACEAGNITGGGRERKCSQVCTRIVTSKLQLYSVRKVCCLDSVAMSTMLSFQLCRAMACCLPSLHVSRSTMPNREVNSGGGTSWCNMRLKRSAVASSTSEDDPPTMGETVSATKW